VRFLWLPMAKNSFYFYLSGLLSFLLFIIILLAVMFFALSNSRAKSYALKKENYIAVSIMTDQKISTKNNTDQTLQSAPKPPAKPESKPAVEKTVDISSMFSSVKTKKIVYKKKARKKPKKIIDQKRIAALQKRLKTTSKKNTSVASNKLKKLNLVKPSVQERGSAASGGSDVNEYYAKIQAFVYEQFYPPANTEGQVAKVYISLDKMGHLLEYRVLVYSSNSMFNREVDQLKNRLMSLRFPKHPDMKAATLNIELISEGVE